MVHLLFPVLVLTHLALFGLGYDPRSLPLQHVIVGLYMIVLLECPKCLSLSLTTFDLHNVKNYNYIGAKIIGF